MRRLPALDYSLQSTECPVVVHAAEVAWELGISTLRFNFRGVGLGKLYPLGGDPCLGAASGEGAATAPSYTPTDSRWANQCGGSGLDGPP